MEVIKLYLGIILSSNWLSYRKILKYTLYYLMGNFGSQKRNLHLRGINSRHSLWAGGPFSQCELLDRQKTCFNFFFSTILLWKVLLCWILVKAVQFKSGARQRLIFRAQRDIICKILWFCVEYLHFPLFSGVTRGNRKLGKLLTELEISKQSALDVSDGKIRPGARAISQSNSRIWDSRPLRSWGNKWEERWQCSVMQGQPDSQTSSQSS